MQSNPLHAQPCASSSTGFQYKALVMAVAAVCTSLAHSQESASQPALTEMTVTATRSEALVNSVPQSITVVRREEIEQQVSAGSGLGDILGKLVPGFGLGRESPS